MASGREIPVLRTQRSIARNCALCMRTITGMPEPVVFDRPPLDFRVDLFMGFLISRIMTGRQIDPLTFAELRFGNIAYRHEWCVRANRFSADELADIVIIADLLAWRLGIDLGRAIRDRFKDRKDETAGADR